ncbi:MAG: tetratricopeptide repeat protein [candidate division WOR-3 bacterium]|nr:MAG: tetratricopeptide repeat protein [candidate division WOR-3 bacterium]
MDRRRSFKQGLIRLAVPVAVPFVMLLLSAGCPPAQQQAGAVFPSERWGISKALAPATAETRLAAAHRVLYERKFEDALDAYRELAAEFPASAEAHLGLSMALRYTGNVDSALVECGRALELDPDAVASLCNYADLITPYRGAKTLKPMSDEERFAKAEEYFKKALQSSHRLAAYARTGLWCNYMATGQLTRAREQIAELGRAHYFPPALLSMANNMLVDLDSNAVIFTNGDNDTYPLYALQQAEGFRSDVSVVNLSLLNLETVAALWRDSFDVPISLTDEELTGLKARKGGDGSVVTPSDRLVADIIEHAPAAGRPVYFAITVYKDRLDPYQDRLVLEGFVYRVADRPVSRPVDIDRLASNVRQKYRMDVPGALEPWIENLSPITRHLTPLAYNHFHINSLLADHFAEAGDQQEARRYLHDMYHSSEHAGLVDGMKLALDQWLKLYPDDPEALDLKHFYEGRYPATERTEPEAS